MYVVSFYITLNRVQRNSEIVGGTIAWAGVPEIEGENELQCSLSQLPESRCSVTSCLLLLWPSCLPMYCTTQLRAKVDSSSTEQLLPLLPGILYSSESCSQHHHPELHHSLHLCPPTGIRRSRYLDLNSGNFPFACPPSASPGGLPEVPQGSSSPKPPKD